MNKTRKIPLGCSCCVVAGVHWWSGGGLCDGMIIHKSTKNLKNYLKTLWFGLVVRFGDGRVRWWSRGG